MEKSVLGRLRVFFSSSGACIFAPKIRVKHHYRGDFLVSDNGAGFQSWFSCYSEMFIASSSRAPFTSARLHQRASRGEFTDKTSNREQHKVPPAYSRADEYARSLYRRRDDEH